MSFSEEQKNSIGISYILSSLLQNSFLSYNLFQSSKHNLTLICQFRTPLAFEPTLSLPTVMELFQELVFTISFSLIVSLLIAKLFSIASSFDDESLTTSRRVEENIEKEWVVCGSETEGKGGYFEDSVKVSGEAVCGCGEAEFGNDCVIEKSKSVGGVDAGYVFDESLQRTDFGVDEGYVFDQMPERPDDGVDAIYVFDESPKRTEFRDNDVSLMKGEEGNVVSSRGSLVGEDCVNSIEVQQESSAIDGGEVKIEDEDEDRVLDDDWQGIETTELDKSFGAAVAFMGSKSNVDRVSLIDNEVKMQLYGLHKVAIEGACFESQPMALKVSARANWNAWKRLENLGREDAMEQYIALLSRHVPDWMGSHVSENDMQDFVTPRAENNRVQEQMKPCIDYMLVEDSNIIITDKQ